MERHTHELLARSGLVGRYSEMRFKDMAWHEGQKLAVQTAIDFVREFPSKPGFILCGSNGCGKSHILAATVRVCCARGIAAEFWPTVKLTHHLSRLLMKDCPDEVHPADRLVHLPVLALDDAGQEKLTDRGRDSLFYILDGRYVDRKPVVVSTNKTVAQLEDHLGRAMTSRLLGMCDWVDVPACVPDFRLSLL